MKLSLRPAIASAAVLAIAGGVLAATVSMAAAATTPPWEPDVNALGTLTFYNSAGQVVTGGNNLNHLFDYAVASTADATHGTKATLEFAQPLPSTATGNFGVGAASLSTNFPNAAAPAPIGTTANPVVTLGATDANLTNFIATQVPPTAPGFVNVYQLRVFTGGAGGVGTSSANYWDADVQVNPANGTWTQVYPTVVTATSTTLTASANPATVGVSDTLTATETPATAGSVDFKDGTTDLGSAAVNGSGVATMATTFTTAATHNLTATFTPTDTVNFGGSSGTLALVVNPAATPTATTLAVTQNGSTGSPIALSSTVTPTAAAGTVSWFDNGSSTPLNATPVTVTGGAAAFTVAAGLGAGSHSIVAVFAPTSVTAFEASQSAPQTFTLQAPLTGACLQTGSNCTDTQNIQGTIPVGTLVLSTPYTAAKPLDLGNLALNAGLTEYSANAPFTSISIVDTRSGDLPWTLTALATNLSDGGSHPGSIICSQNVGLTTITSVPGTGFAGTITPTDNPAPASALAPVGGACTGAGGLGGTLPHTVATTNAGLGTVTLAGTLTLVAPTSTEPGLFTGTITFTVG